MPPEYFLRGHVETLVGDHSTVALALAAVVGWCWLSVLCAAAGRACDRVRSRDMKNLLLAYTKPADWYLAGRAALLANPAG